MIVVGGSLPGAYVIAVPRDVAAAAVDDALASVDGIVVELARQHDDGGGAVVPSGAAEHQPAVPHGTIALARHTQQQQKNKTKKQAT